VESREIEEEESNKIAINTVEDEKDPELKERRRDKKDRKRYKDNEG
jgi:hypothetical protein